MLEAVINGDALQALAVMPVGVDVGNVAIFCEILLVPVVERAPAWVSELVDHRLRAEVVFDEQLDCPQLIFP